MIIRIHQLKAQTILGIYPEELETPREVILDIGLTIDPRPVLASDDIADTLDYAAISEHLVAWLATKRTGLAELLAEQLLDQLPKHPYLRSATLTLHKPGCVPGAEGISVTVSRDFTSHMQKNCL